MHYILVALLALILSACTSDGGDSGGPFNPTIIIQTGYSYALDGITLYIPAGIHPDPHTGNAPEFGDVGHLLKAWRGFAGADSSTPVRTADGEAFAIELTMVILTPQDSAATCQQLSGADNSSCAVVNLKQQTCTIYISRVHDDWVWGHELWHCMYGLYHDQ